MSNQGQIRRIRCAQMIQSMDGAAEATSAPTLITAPAVITGNLPAMKQQLSEIAGAMTLTQMEAAPLERITTTLVEQFSLPEKVVQTELQRLDTLLPATAQIEQVLTQLSQQHRTVFKENLTRIVEEATVEAGFDRGVDVVVRENSPVIRIIGETGQGHTLISEIRIEEHSHEIHIDSETFGFEDQACALAFRSFEQALSKRGVVGAERRMHYKGPEGEPRIPVGEISGRKSSGSRSRQQAQKRDRN